MQTMTETKKLTRSRSDRMICGVCGGLADYLNVDPVIVRLAFVFLAMADGVGLLAYVALCVIMPETAADEATDRPAAEPEFVPLGKPNG
jgi:phage shock protein C